MISTVVNKQEKLKEYPQFLKAGWNLTFSLWKLPQNLCSYLAVFHPVVLL